MPPSSISSVASEETRPSICFCLRHVYEGTAAGILSYETFNVCCVLLPGDLWKKMEPRTGRIMQVQGSSPFPYSYYVILPSDKIFLSLIAPDPGHLIGFYLVNGHVSPCLLTQTLSYLGQPVATESASTAPPSPIAPSQPDVVFSVPDTFHSPKVA
jgi:hypothetical protein